MKPLRHLALALCLGGLGVAPAFAQEGGPTLPQADAQRAAVRAKYPLLVAREWEKFGRLLYQKAIGKDAGAMGAFWAGLKAQEGVEPYDFLNQLNCHWFVKVMAGHQAHQSAFMLYGKVVRAQGARHIVRAYGSEGYFSRMLLGGPVRANPGVDGVLPAHMVAGQELLVENLSGEVATPGQRFTGAAVPLGRLRLALGYGQFREQVVVRCLPKLGD